jgi:hypothetical protein
VRLVAAAILCLVSIVLFFAGIAIPLMLPSQVAENRIYFQQFEKAAAYVNSHGKLPDKDVLAAWAEQVGSGSIWNSLVDQAFNCDPGFAKAPSDRFVLSFWRGEWSECYAYPSGKTTMPMSVGGYLWSGLGVDIAIYWAIAIASGWGAWRLMRSWLSIRQQKGSGA